MITVGAFEAKTHLSALLDWARVNDAFGKLKILRKGTTFGGLSWKELRDNGRP